MTRFLTWFLCVALVTACSSLGTVGPTPPSALSEIAPSSVQASPSTPGLVIRGHVRLSDGAGLPNVIICRNFASYPGTVVARTDQKGYYQAAFVAIPEDEMVGVWALLPGYTFEPKTVRWRHYHGFEEQILEFLAIPSSATDVPPVPCS